MTPLHRVAIIGNYLPRRCGLATFTHDLHQAVSSVRPDLETTVVAMNDPGCSYDYPAAVGYQIQQDDIDSYRRAADDLNARGVDVVSLQHEYGIFGGEAGRNILTLLDRLKMPVITTLHTVLATPTPAQHEVLTRIIARSKKLVVMAEKGRALLQSVHGVPSRMIDVIPHGIPDVPFVEPSVAKAKLGFSGKTIILTFGLLSPSKGIETVIDAMPAIIKSCPDAMYVVLGATHPNLVRQHGEAYRDSLMARVRSLGIEAHVVFINQFVDQPSLLDFISMCDVYVTPYLNEAQMTSGTLAYSFGLGKAVVSTPYWHAKELLADGLGALVAFGDTAAIGSQISALLTNDVRRHAMRKRAYAASRSMTWARTGQRYAELFETAHQAKVAAGYALNRRPDIGTGGSPAPRPATPAVQLGYFLSMCDSTGLLQHAVHCVPDRSHGYCVDDNARALLLSCALSGAHETQLPEPLSTRFAAFIQHAWNSDTRRFRNFMSYERKWLEPQGSEDSHGRTLWSLGVCAAQDRNPSRRQWAADLFLKALPVVEDFTSPRAWAFTLLGLDAYCAHAPSETIATRLRDLLAGRLMEAVSTFRTDSWVWFEEVLAYDNARLPQALILTGAATHRAELVDAGLETLRWLMTKQTAPSGHFRPIGSESFGIKHHVPHHFDQQPVEVTATISAYLAAWRADGDPAWIAGANSAFAWFVGDNDLHTALIDEETGSCRDGLHPDRANENRGAESVLSYLLALIEIRQFERMAVTDLKRSETAPPRSARTRVAALRIKSGDQLVSLPVLESPGTSSAARSSPGRRTTVQAGNRAEGSQSDG